MTVNEAIRLMRNEGMEIFQLEEYRFDTEECNEAFHKLCNVGMICIPAFDIHDVAVKNQIQKAKDAEPLPDYVWNSNNFKK